MTRNELREICREHASRLNSEDAVVGLLEIVYTLGYEDGYDDGYENGTDYGGYIKVDEGAEDR